MSRNTKIALGIFGGILVICICLGVGALITLRSFGKAITQSFKTNPTDIAQIASGIAQFDTPPGYKVNAMSILGIDMLVITPTYPGQPIFMMMKYPPNQNFDSDQFQTMIERSVGQQYFGRGMTFRNIGQTAAYFRSQRVNLIMMEGTTSTGRTILEEMGAFQGNNGPVFLSIMGDRASWDQSTVDTFLHSIR
jgi:hypothetical protein